MGRKKVQYRYRYLVAKRWKSFSSDSDDEFVDNFISKETK